MKSADKVMKKKDNRELFSPGIPETESKTQLIYPIKVKIDRTAMNNTKNKTQLLEETTTSPHQDSPQM